MMRIRLAGKSVLNRRASVLLTLVSLTIAIMLVLGINHLRTQVKEGFNNTLSGTDLIVGARGSSLNLLLYSVFHLGNASHTIRWDSYQELSKHSQVSWVIPMALGDSHKGYRVVATTPDFFTHYAYGQKQALGFSAGQSFAQPFEVVIGAAVARALNYGLGDKIILAHGVAEIAIHKHDETPFRITGVLAPSGTPVDKSIYISLASMAALHSDWQTGVYAPTAHSKPKAKKQEHSNHSEREQHHQHQHQDDHEHEHEHEHQNQQGDDAQEQSLSALLVGLKSRAATFTLQRQVNQYSGEPLQAIVPGLALAELWQLMSSVETAFNLIAWLVVLASLLGMTTSLLAASNEREREFAILRSLGAGPSYLFILAGIEVFLVSISAIGLALASLTAMISLLQPWILATWGLHISANVINLQQLTYLAVVLLMSLLLSVIPSLIASKRSLTQGLSIRR